jgi:hypothetical protein
MSKSRRARILDCHLGVWGTVKLRNETNIWRKIARPDECGGTKGRSVGSRGNVDCFIMIRRRLGVAGRTLSELEVCA